MPRNYAAEYQASQLRAWRRGFRSEYQERRERQRIQAAEAHPSLQLREEFRRPGDWQEAGIQGPYSPSPDLDPSSNIPDWDYYWPTRTINPPRPATLQARWSARHQQMQVVFRDGTPWTYTGINEEFWMAFKKAPSPGRVIYSLWPKYSFLTGSVTNQEPGGWGSIVGEG